jgi:hypothetical protein
VAGVSVQSVQSLWLAKKKMNAPERRNRCGFSGIGLEIDVDLQRKREFDFSGWLLVKSVALNLPI